LHQMTTLTGRMDFSDLKFPSGVNVLRYGYRSGEVLVVLRGNTGSEACDHVTVDLFQLLSFSESLQHSPPVELLTPAGIFVFQDRSQDSVTSAL